MSDKTARDLLKFLKMYDKPSIDFSEFTQDARKEFEELLEMRILNFSKNDPKIKEKIISCLENSPKNDLVKRFKEVVGNVENTESPTPKLCVQIQPGTAPENEIAGILADISLIFRKMGGNGIEFKLDGVVIKKEELV